jgi:Tat protein secretion system quality control protein TatD with DNase activity
VVQVHCFLGGRGDLGKWLEAFPKCLFSFGHRSLALTGNQQEEHQMAARSLSLDQILLESDAPHLQRLPRAVNQYTGPASPRRDLYEVGAWLGRLKGLCPSIVLEAARLNALRAFSIPDV